MNKVNQVGFQCDFIGWWKSSAILKTILSGILNQWSHKIWQKWLKQKLNSIIMIRYDFIENIGGCNLSPGIHAPEPVGPRTAPHQNNFEILGPHRTRTAKFLKNSYRTAPGSIKPEKYRTKSHRAVRGPIGAWVPAYHFFRNVLG